MAGASAPYYLLKEEFIQRRDEGCEIPAELQKRYHALNPETDAWDLQTIDPIYDELMALEADPDLAAAEPDELNAIRALRPDGPRNLNWKPDEAELLDKLHGAWTGRCVGCALGKPVENRGMRRDENHHLHGRKLIKDYLQKRDDWPLTDYFSNRDIGDGDRIPPFRSYRENIQFMEGDDDIHYSLVGLGVLEKHGPDFTWRNVGRYWLSHIPISGICTAEAQAILNLQNRSRKGSEGPATAEWCRQYRNPYREWIGAQIRADAWAWACAGNPEKAAEFAWRDAHWSHARNGIYGEMMFAAIQAAAFVIDDPAELIQIGLSEIPADCRLARWVARCLDWVKQAPDFEACMDLLEAELDEMHAVHTINNALICIISMYYGRLDTTQTPAISVMCGLDTDCNGATVGSIVGAIAGRKNFGGKLADKLNDSVQPNMLGFREVTMTELANRTVAVWHQVRDHA